MKFHFRAAIISIASVFITLQAQATFVPDEEIKFGMMSRGPSNISEAQFNEIIQRVQSAYEGTVKAVGGNLFISGEWKSETPNAYARQVFGAWMVQITGGLARRPELTPDGFTLVLCHELGHHLGGFAFTSTGFLPMFIWAANEGQSDYYATQVCARKLWGPEKEINASFRNSVSSFVIDKCDSVWSAREDRDLCYRITAAVESLSQTMAGIVGKSVPDFTTPDTTVVSKTNNKHPAVQCRMDTGLQGALCPAAFNEKIIPGKDTKGGTSGIEAEKEAARYSCTKSSGYTVGLRPTCWFKPRL